jgi:hypothetical protein
MRFRNLFLGVAFFSFFATFSNAAVSNTDDGLNFSFRLRTGGTYLRFSSEMDCEFGSAAIIFPVKAQFVKFPVTCGATSCYGETSVNYTESNLKYTIHFRYAKTPESGSKLIYSVYHPKLLAVYGQGIVDLDMHPGKFESKYPVRVRKDGCREAISVNLDIH